MTTSDYLTCATPEMAQAATGPWQRSARCAGNLAFLALDRAAQLRFCTGCVVRELCEHFGLFDANEGRSTPLPRGTDTAFPCSHPRTPENTVRNGHRASGEAIYACRMCCSARRRKPRMTAKR